MNLETILTHYLTAMLWTEELDTDYDTSDVHSDSVTKAKEDIKAFTSDCKDLLNGWTDELIGQDFWLTRNGHGAGFWDRDLPNSQEITKVCEAYNISAHVFTIDGQVHAEY